MENSRRRRQGYSRRWILLGVPIILLGAWLYPYIPGRDLDVCAIRFGLGVNCPGCGFIRALSALVHGDPVRSIAFNPMGVVALALLISLWLKTIAETVLGRGVNILGPAAVKMVNIAFIVGLFVQWFISIFSEFPVVSFWQYHN